MAAKAQKPPPGPPDPGSQAARETSWRPGPGFHGLPETSSENNVFSIFFLKLKSAKLNNMTKSYLLRHASPFSSSKPIEGISSALNPSAIVPEGFSQKGRGPPPGLGFATSFGSIQSTSKGKSKGKSKGLKPKSCHFSYDRCTSDTLQMAGRGPRTVWGSYFPSVGPVPTQQPHLVCQQQQQQSMAMAGCGHSIQTNGYPYTKGDEFG